jgi:trans-aconitate methyltransferase
MIWQVQNKLDCQLKQARRSVEDLQNVVLLQSDFTEVTLPTKLDVIFSNAALQWVHNHAQVFRHFWKILSDRSNGRQLLIQCGGYGNLHRILTLLRRVMQLNEFEEYFTDMNQPWHFAKPDETSKLLGKIGYVNINVHLHNDCVNLTYREIYSKLVRTVIMNPFLERIPKDKIRNRYLELFLDEVEERCTSSKKPETPWSLDYVRLNITADKP